MKKMNKMYEAPQAEIIEMQTISVLMSSAGTDITGGGSGNGMTGW